MQEVQGLIAGLQRWIWLLMIGLGITLTSNVEKFCRGVSIEREHGELVFLDFVTECRIVSTAALYVILFIYLVRWYMQNQVSRMERQQ